MPEDTMLSQGSQQERSEGAVYPDRGAAPAGFRQTDIQCIEILKNKFAFFFSKLISAL